MKNTFRYAAPVLLSLTCLSTSVWAQTPASTPAAANAPARHSASAGRTTTFVEKRLNELHSELQITSAQSEQWDAFAKTMRDSAQKTQEAYQDRDQKIATMNADDAMKSYAALTQMHADNTKDLSAAFSTLYASFSDSQKQKADVLFRHERTKRQAASPRHRSAAPASAPQAASN